MGDLRQRDREEGIREEDGTWNRSLVQLEQHRRATTVPRTARLGDSRGRSGPDEGHHERATGNQSVQSLHSGFFSRSSSRLVGSSRAVSSVRSSSLAN